MGMVWEAYRKGVPLLGVPRKFPYRFPKPRSLPKLEIFIKTPNQWENIGEKYHVIFFGGGGKANCFLGGGWVFRGFKLRVKMKQQLVFLGLWKIRRNIIVLNLIIFSWVSVFSFSGGVTSGYVIFLGEKHDLQLPMFNFTGVLGELPR